MGGRVDGYRVELRGLKRWEPYLKKHSGLPGPRANLERITSSLAATTDRKKDEFKVLRQALGYCWSVAAAAAPDNAKPYFEKWMGSTDKDVAWVMKTNLGKARAATLREKLTPKPVVKRRIAKAARVSPPGRGLRPGPTSPRGGEVKAKPKAKTRK